MVENSQSLYAAADRVRLMHVCRADLATLALLEQDSAPDAFRSHRLSQVRTFLHVLERGRACLPYTQVDCMVCERYSEDYWLFSSVRNKHRGMHCAAHTFDFHAVAPAAWNCCDPPYHPAHDYVWRAAEPGRLPPLAVFELRLALDELSEQTHSQDHVATAAHSQDVSAAHSQDHVATAAHSQDHASAHSLDYAASAAHSPARDS